MNILYQTHLALYRNGHPYTWLASGQRGIQQHTYKVYMYMYMYVWPIHIHVSALVLLLNHEAHSVLSSILIVKVRQPKLIIQTVECKSMLWACVWLKVAHFSFLGEMHLLFCLGSRTIQYTHVHTVYICTRVNIQYMEKRV